MIEINFVMRLKDSKQLHKFVQKVNYEEFLMKLLIQSNLFSSQLEMIASQSNGEGDFYDPVTNFIFEATLLLNQDMVSSIIKNPKYLASKEMMHHKTSDLEKLFRERIKNKMKKSLNILVDQYRLSGAVDTACPDQRYQLLNLFT